MASPSCTLVDSTFGPYAGNCRGGFDFTLLFEETILTVLPLVVLISVAPLRVLYLLQKRIKVVPSTLLPLKLTSLAIHGVLQLALLVLWAEPSTLKTRASVPTAVLSLIGSLTLVILSYAEHVYSIQPSNILNVYLFFSAVFDATRTRTLSLQEDNEIIAVILLVTVVLKTVILLIEASEKRRILLPEYHSYPPEAVAGIISRFFFWWQIPLFRQGFSKSLSIDDLFALDRHLNSERLQLLMQSAWEKVSTKSPNTLFFLAIKVLRWPLLSIVFPRLCLIAFNFCQPFLISTTLDWSDQPLDDQTYNKGYGLIGAYFLVYVGIAISMGQYQHLTFRAITMVRGGLISMLYHKATDLSVTSVDPAASLTLMSADIERITNGWQTMHEVWANLIEIIIAIYLLERQLGVACVIPVAVAIVSIAGSLVAISFIMSRQALWLEAIERRIAATSAMLSSMKGVKMCGLTEILLASLQKLRTDELEISKSFRRLLIWNMALAYMTPVIAPVLTFTVFSVMARNGGSYTTLDTSKAYTCLTLFALLQEPLSSFIMSLSTFTGSVGCFTRIQAFLETDVRVDSRIKPKDHYADSYPSSKAPSISQVSDDKAGNTALEATIKQLTGYSPESDAMIVQDGSFGWDRNEAPLLSDINITVPRSKFTMLVGPVGCGKSTLLKALLGEVATMRGTIEVTASRIAYCDQTAWHMNGSVRESIIAVSEVDERWYMSVIRACALDEDLRQLPRGDQTTIGSKGIALSGGQSQRIALARAIYAQEDILILDDVLSGLDAHTENRVFHNLFGVDGLLRRLNTTILVASSSAKRLPYADHIICIDAHGKLSEQGSFKQLDAAGGYVASFNLSPADWTYFPEQESRASNQFAISSVQPKPNSTIPEEPEDEASRRMGDSAIYLYYVQSIGWTPTIIFIVAITAYIFCMSFPTIWVGWWASFNSSFPNQNLGYYLGIYAFLGIMALVFLVVSCWQMIITMVPRSARNFHWTLLKTVLNSPMSFFSTTDTGITINRFSQDLQLIDMDLPIAALNTFATFVLCIAQMVLIGIGSRYTAISFPFIIFALFLIQRFYLRTSRQIRFLDLEAKSPLYSQFMECLNGLATLRAFGWQNALEEKNRKLLDRSQQPFYLLFAVQRWLTLVLDMFVAGLAVLLIIIIVVLRGKLSSNLIGVALVNVILFSQTLKLLLTFWTTLETHIGAIARIKSFTTDAVSEHQPSEKEPAPVGWPSQGAIEFDSVSAAYRPSEPVLKSISFSIESGQKIGICGRTGSGKSSVILALFRMLELSAGTITVDGIDISTLPREEVRSKIVGVPQDAFLLDTCVRTNVDPTQSLSDATIISALQDVQLWDIVQDKGGLDTHIDKLFLSHGQKQLFCLARAMLRPSTILVLDEATSSIDASTERLTQRLIRTRFASRTIIAVAHRLDSILDFDRVALMDGGQLLEYDSPHALLQRPTSAFSRLYNALMVEQIEIKPEGSVGVSGTSSGNHSGTGGSGTATSGASRAVTASRSEASASASGSGSATASASGSGAKHFRGERRGR